MHARLILGAKQLVVKENFVIVVARCKGRHVQLLCINSNMIVGDYLGGVCLWRLEHDSWRLLGGVCPWRLGISIMR